MLFRDYLIKSRCLAREGWAENEVMIILYHLSVVSCETTPCSPAKPSHTKQHHPAMTPTNAQMTCQRNWTENEVIEMLYHRSSVIYCPAILLPEGIMCDHALSEVGPSYSLSFWHFSLPFDNSDSTLLLVCYCLFRETHQHGLKIQCSFIALLKQAIFFFNYTTNPNETCRAMVEQPSSKSVEQLSSTVEQPLAVARRLLDGARWLLGRLAQQLLDHCSTSAHWD